MTAYEELLEFGGERIFDFLKNARLHESQFKYSEFNEVCYKKMYIENNQDSIKTVKELKEEIPELKDTCKGCGSYFMNPRNKSIKGLDVQFGRLLEDVIIDFLKTKYKLNVTHGDNSNKKYPDCMLLSGDKGILAYFEVKYHGAPFISAINKIGRYCYEGSATLDLNKLVKQIEIVESELDRPVFYLHWIDYPCLKGLQFCILLNVQVIIFLKYKLFFLNISYPRNGIGSISLSFPNGTGERFKKKLPSGVSIL